MCICKKFLLFRFFQNCLCIYYFRYLLFLYQLIYLFTHIFTWFSFYTKETFKKRQIQPNLLIADILYSGHLSATDIIFRSQLTLPSRNDPSIANTPNNRPYKTFLVRNLPKFYFGQCFTISFKFSSIFIILFLGEFNGLFRSIKMKNCRYFKSVFTSMIDVFSSFKDVNAQWDKGRNTNTIMEISVVHGQPPLLYSVN